MNKIKPKRLVCIQDTLDWMSISLNEECFTLKVIIFFTLDVLLASGHNIVHTFTASL